MSNNNHFGNIRGTVSRARIHIVECGVDSDGDNNNGDNEQDWPHEIDDVSLDNLSHTIEPALFNDIKLLSQEFDLLGMHPVESTSEMDSNNLFKEIIFNSRYLIKIYKDAMKNLSKAQNTITNINQKNRFLEEKLIQVKNEGKDNIIAYERLKYKFDELKSEYIDIEKLLSKSKCDNDKLKSHYRSKIDEMDTIIKNQDEEIHRLENVIINRQSNDKEKDDNQTKMYKLLNEFKSRETHYKTTIIELQQNNDGLVKQVMDMRNQFKSMRN